MKNTVSKPKKISSKKTQEKTKQPTPLKKIHNSSNYWSKEKFAPLSERNAKKLEIENEDMKKSKKSMIINNLHNI